MLTAKIDSPEWTTGSGGPWPWQHTRSGVNAAMIKEVLTGNEKAYEAIAKFTGQTDKTEADQEEQRKTSRQRNRWTAYTRIWSQC